MSNAAVNRGVQISLQDPAFNSFAEVGLLVEYFLFVFHKNKHLRGASLHGPGYRSWLGSEGSLSQVKLPEWRESVFVCWRCIFIFKWSLMALYWHTTCSAQNTTLFV